MCYLGISPCHTAILHKLYISSNYTYTAGSIIGDLRWHLHDIYNVKSRRIGDSAVFAYIHISLNLKQMCEEPPISGPGCHGTLAPCKGGFYRVTVTQKYIRKTTGIYPICAVHWYNFVLLSYLVVTNVYSVSAMSSCSSG